MGVLKRPPGDDFTFRLFFKLKGQVKHPASFIYIWSCVLDPVYEFGWWPAKDKWETETELDYRIRLMDEIKSDLVIIGVKDHLTSGEFNYWKDNTPVIVEYLKNMFDYYPNKQFILFTSVENLESYIQQSNVRIVPWGGDITNHQPLYNKLEPVLDKNFDSNYTYLSLNRNKRSHRAMLLALLYSLDLTKHGLISCMFKDKIDNLFEYTQWPETEVYKQGFEKFKLDTLKLNDDPEIYNNGNNDNVTNFKNKLVPYYRDTFVEIITETSYTESCFNLTEKTLNSIYGCCFPILLCSQGSVSFLRNMGMDMFDDIIDHSYDSISDPAERLNAAITRNVAILTNPKIKEIWKNNKPRFVKNVDFAKETLYTFYKSRAETVFAKIMHDFNI